MRRRWSFARRCVRFIGLRPSGWRSEVARGSRPAWTASERRPGVRPIRKLPVEEAALGVSRRPEIVSRAIDRPELALHFADHLAMASISEVDTVAKAVRRLVQQMLRRLRLQSGRDQFRTAATRVMDSDRVRPARRHLVTGHLDDGAAICLHMRDGTLFPLVQLAFTEP